MGSLLAVLVLLMACALTGIGLLRRHFTALEAGWLLASSLIATCAVTLVRYRIAIAGSEYEALTSDTFRYLLYGRDRWLTGESVLSGIAARDGTTGTITLSQIAFSSFGDHWFAIFLAGSLVGLVGSWLMAASIRAVLPASGVHFAYTACLFPSVLYWSSSFGKEAFSLLAVGLASYSVARRSGQSARSTSLAGLGGLTASIAIAWVVRPEIAFLVVGAIVAAWCAIRSGQGTRMRRAVLAFGVVGVPAALVVASTFGYSDPLGLIDDLTTRHERTSIGESQIGVARPGGLAGLLLGLPTAILRPFPWEAGLGGLGSSLDTILIAVTAAALWRARGHLNRLDVASARLLVFSVTLVLVLFGPLAGYGNLGLLARMRSLTIPALVVVLAIARSTQQEDVSLSSAQPPGSTSKQAPHGADRRRPRAASLRTGRMARGRRPGLWEDARR